MSKPFFESTLDFYLGLQCKANSGHEFESTGKSIRTREDGSCAQCHFAKESAKISSLLSHRWVEVDSNAFPEIPGIYGIQFKDSKRWFYIGKAENIAKRLQSSRHPLAIAKSLRAEFRFFYIHCPENRTRIENSLIRLLKPLGNSGTSFSSLYERREGAFCEIRYYWHGYRVSRETYLELAEKEPVDYRCETAAVFSDSLTSTYIKRASIEL